MSFQVQSGFKRPVMHMYLLIHRRPNKETGDYDVIKHIPIQGVNSVQFLNRHTNNHLQIPLHKHSVTYLTYM